MGSGISLGVALLALAGVAWMIRRSAGGGADALRSELAAMRADQERREREAREELSQSLRHTGESLTLTLSQIGTAQQQAMSALQQRLDHLRETQAAGTDRLRGIVDDRLREIQKSSEQRLDQMRATVDEKLQSTLEKRLGESFRVVSERLEAVQRGLGEMQQLAHGVGDLKRVLTNVKTRGTWAEVQLGALLEQVLTSTQFERNVKVRPDSDALVEFAVRLPGPRRDDPSSCVYLPIDSKFPKEDYERLQDAAERADAAECKKASDALLATLRKEAQRIQSKYIAPPHTTDFAILFLPTEGLYAEMLRAPGFADELLNQYRIIPAGPTTLAALLSSLRAGFRTLAIEQRAAEVLKALAAVREEFGKFGGALEKLHKNLQVAQNSVGAIQQRTRVMQRTLNSFDQSSGALEIPDAAPELEIPAPEMPAESQDA